MQEEAGITGVYLEQLHAFGAPDRDPRERVISIAFLGLAAQRDAATRADSDALEARWLEIARVPRLAFDHADILRTAKLRLEAADLALTYAIKLLQPVFTLTELQACELLSGTRMDKRNFRKRIRRPGCVEPAAGLRRTGRHRPGRALSWEQLSSLTGAIPSVSSAPP